MSADRVKTPFDVLIEKFNEMLVHVDVSPDYRKELRQVVVDAKNTVGGWHEKFMEPEPFNIETAIQILTVFKSENEDLKDRVCMLETHNSQLRSVLERMEAWLEARHLGGLMPDEKALLNTTTKTEYKPNKNIQPPPFQTVSEGYDPSDTDIIQEQARKINELQTVVEHAERMRATLEYFASFDNGDEIGMGMMVRHAKKALSGENLQNE